MSTTTEKQDAWAQYFWQQPVNASLEGKLNRIAQIEEDWLAVDDMCSNYSSYGSTPIKCDRLQSAGKLEEDKVENEVSNNDESDEDQSQGKGFMPESRTTINQVCVRLGEKAITPSKRQLDTNGNLIPLPPPTPPPEALNCQGLPSVLEKKVIALAAPSGVSSSDVTVIPVAFQGELIPIDNDSRSKNESPRRPYRISKAWKAVEAANRFIGVESSLQNAPIIEGTVNSSGEYKTPDTSSKNRQSKEDLECVEHTDLGSENTAEAANGSISVEDSFQDVPVTEGKINSSGEHKTPDTSGDNRQSKEDLECVEHADLGSENTAEAANGSIGVEDSFQDAPITEGEINSSGEHKTPDTSGDNRQSKEDLECVEHTHLGMKNNAEATNGSIGVESSPRDAPVTEGEINSSGQYSTPDTSGENRQSEEDLECVEHSDLGLENSSEKPDGGAENEVPETGEMITGDNVDGDGGIEDPNVDEGTMEAQYPDEDSIDKKEKPDESLDIEIGNMDARQPSEDSTSKEQEPADKVESDLPVSDGIGEELDETIGTGVLDVEDDDLDVEDEETETQHPVKVDIADEVSPMRSFFSRGLALYMEARGFVEPGDEAMDGEGLENDQGQNAVEPLMRKGEGFIEWGLALLLEAMDGSIGI